MVQYSFPKPDITAKNVVVACRSGVRAGKAVEALQKFGYTSVMYNIISFTYLSIIFLE